MFSSLISHQKVRRKKFLGLLLKAKRADIPFCVLYMHFH